ncbi:unnamed protein product [Polarella glacialis]|uniref:ATP-dependent DNA helicase n=1 Tax=Polarella glacialis TaxID=89957 RepID=A0A813HQ15_POLGL|nr:unnamed protein product [Polarella glacialis]
MLDGDLFSALDAIAASVRGQRKPFGGMQLLLCGDFLQLPPVQGRGQSKRNGLNSGTVMLRESVRQAGDTVFADILNEVRLGVVSERAEALLAACHVSVKPPPDDQIVPTKLYCLNKNVDVENAARLGKLPGQPFVLRCKDHFKGVRDLSRRNMLIALLDKKVPAELKLKVGAQVIMVKNQPALGLVNGSRGRVEAFREGRPVVRFDNGRTVCVGTERFEHKTASASLLRLQVPLKLGWALTVHKAQGMTLSRAELQVDEAFEAGQSYVALSRLTGTAGLWMRGGGISRYNTHAHPDVLDFYERAEKASGRTFSSSSSSSSTSKARLLSPQVAADERLPIWLQELPGLFLWLLLLLLLL